jgi:hypothetical protein
MAEPGAGARRGGGGDDDEDVGGQPEDEEVGGGDEDEDAAEEQPWEAVECKLLFRVYCTTRSLLTNRGYATDFKGGGDDAAARDLDAEDEDPMDNIRTFYERMKGTSREVRAPACAPARPPLGFLPASSLSVCLSSRLACSHTTPFPHLAAIVALDLAHFGSC